MILTEQNWKTHRVQEAKKRFSIGDIVAYDIGFGGFGGSIAFGRVQHISPAATVEIELGRLREVRSNSPNPGYAEFWYDTKEFTPEPRSNHRGGSITTLPFYARLDANEVFVKHRLIANNRIDWRSAEQSIAHGGSLHLLDGSDTYYGLHVEKNGLVRTEEYYR